MSNFAQILDKCRDANGAGSKKAIQEILASADPIAKRLIKEALDPYRVFGVKQFEMPDLAAKTMDHQHSFTEFFALLDELAERRLTGDAARAAVTQALIPFNRRTQEALACVIDKDLRAGFSADTANKVWKEKYIPTFEVMLADKCENTDDFEAYVKFPCQGDWKYDGQRTICIVREGQPVEYRARSGKPMDHLAGTYDEDLSNIRYQVGFDFVMDGESFAGDFTQTINAKKSDNQEAKDALRLRAFFMMPLTDWIAQKTTITMRQNRENLTARLKAANCKRIEISKGREVKDYHDMMEYCNHVIDVEKQEGLILKDWDAVYTWDRTYAWTKVKRFYDVDARIVGWYKGRPKSRLANTCGGVTVEGRDENGKPFRTNVGSGFSDKDRAHIVENFDAIYNGSTMVVSYQEMSKAKGSDIYSLRFPTVKQLLRDDKIVEALGE